MPTSLASFFAPAESSESTSAANLSKASIAPDGDLDSRLANILNSSGEAATGGANNTENSENVEQKRPGNASRKSRWDSDGSNNVMGNNDHHSDPIASNGDLPPPPMPPSDEWTPPPQQWPAIPPNPPAG